MSEKTKISIIGILLVIVMLASVGCDAGPRYVDPDILPYAEAWKQEGLRRGVGVSYDSVDIIFADLDGLSGECRRYAGEVVIDRDGWDSHPGDPDLQYLYRLAIVAHELGHCVLTMDHTGNGIMGSPRIKPADFWDQYEVTWRDYWTVHRFR